MPGITPPGFDSTATVRAPRLIIQAISPVNGLPKYIEALFNPSVIEEHIGVKYGGQVVPGMSHTVLQYSHTENHEIDMDLRFLVDSDLRYGFNAFDDVGIGTNTPGTSKTLDTVLEARRFLMAMCYPRSNEHTVAGGAPSRVLVLWPGLLALVCVIKDVKFKHQQFNVHGQPVDMIADVKFVEIRDSRLTAERVAYQGTERGSETLFVESSRSRANV